jgi:3-methyl-2-oxobutanoate hydroxymethyltransferase
MKDAFKAYTDEVKNGTFPGPEHGYKIDAEIIDTLRKELK